MRCTLEDAYVPEESRLGVEGKGFKIVMETFNHSRPIIGACGVGLAQGAAGSCDHLYPRSSRLVSKLASSRACAG